jgi:hypothetical protein
MQSTTARIGLLGALVAVAVVLFIVLSGNDDDGGGDTTITAAQTTTEAGRETTTDAAGKPSALPPVITVRNGQPVGGVQPLSFSKGDQVRFEVRLDQPAEEVHVHGYEIEEPANTGGPVRFDFPADIDGVFEVEVHAESGDFQIAELTVNP